MSRLWIALALLAAVVGLCVVSQQYLQKETEALLSTLNELEDSYRAGDFTRTRELADALSEEYPRRTRRMHYFITHNDLEDSRQSAAILPAIAESESEDLLMEIARLREELRHLQGIDSPSLENIL